MRRRRHDRSGLSALERSPISRARAAAGLLFAAAIITLAGHPPAAQSPAYTFYQVDAGFSPAMDVNNRNEVIGYWIGPAVSSDPNSQSRGYRWTPDTGPQPLITDPANVRRFPAITPINDPTRGLRLNDNGTVVGTGCPDGCGIGFGQAAILGQEGLQFLPFLSQGQLSGGTDINADGTAVGMSFLSGLSSQAPFVWDPVRGVRSLGLDGASVLGFATATNRAGMIVGACADCFGIAHGGFVWTESDGLNQITPLVGHPDARLEGMAVNAVGEVVGRWFDLGANGIFRWTSADGTEDLSAPSGVAETIAMNDSGDIVASIDVATGGVAAYIYREGAWVNLNALLPPATPFIIQYAEAINNAGWIVGVGTTDSTGVGSGQGFVLVPTSASPVASDATVTTKEDTAISGVLIANDSNQSVLAFGIVRPPAAGTVTLVDSTSGAYTYVPNANVNGTDTFTFKASNGQSDSNIATVTVAITPVNDAPLAGDAALALPAGTTVAGTLIATDVDNASLTYAIRSAPLKGAVTVTDPHAGTFLYAANAGANGTDTFTFTATDDELTSNVATVTVTILPAACVPMADVTARLDIRLDPPRVVRQTGHLTQRVRVENRSGGAITGPLLFVVDALTPGATLVGAAGTTTCSIGGRPYTVLDIGPDPVFSIRERVEFVLEFVPPPSGRVSFGPRLLAGSGTP